MTGFYGSYDYSVDLKGRINIPVAFREILSISPSEAMCYVTLGPFIPDPYRCLSIFSKDVFEAMGREIQKEYGSFISPNPKHREFLMVTQHVQPCKWDAQGRIMVTRKLLQEAAIEKAVRIIGAVDHIELWNPDSLQAYLRKDGSAGGA